MASIQARLRVNGEIENLGLKFKQRRPVLPAGAEFISCKILDRDENGKKIQIGHSFKDLSAALAALETLDGPQIQQAASPEAAMQAPVERTWKSLQDEYTDRLRLEVKKGNLAESSVNRYLRTFREFDAFLKAKNIVSLKDITFRVMEAFKEHRIDDGAPNAFVCDIKNLNPVFEYALRQDLISKNPVEYESPKGDAERGAQPFSTEELTRMQGALNGDALMFWMLYQTGLRRSDVIDLKWRDIANGVITRVAQKNKRRVEIPLLPQLEEALNTERAKRDPSPSDFVLLDPESGRPFAGRTLYNRVGALGKRGGVDGAHPHRFRDTFAVECLMRGLDEAEAAEYLGDDIKTFRKHYKTWVKGLADRAAAKFRGGKGLL